MKLEDIKLLFAYNDWANRRIMAAAALVTPEQFTAPTSDSYGSLRGTLLHTLEAEYSWRMLCQHSRFVDDLKEVDFPSPQGLSNYWEKEEQEMRTYLGGLQDKDVTGFVRYTTDSGIKRERVLWHCLWHVVNHGTQHRSESAAILTDLGHSPGDVDFTLFMNG